MGMYMWYGLLSHTALILSVGGINYIQFQKYKRSRIQRKTFDYQFTIHDVWHTLSLTGFNLLISLLCYAFVWEYWISLDHVNTWFMYELFKLCFYSVIAEIWFYTSHRIFHAQAWLYRHIHKVHHTYSTVISFCALYTHPLDHLITNIGSLFIGPLLVHPHSWTLLIWINMGLVNALMTHSGIIYPRLPRFWQHMIIHHDFHHSHFTINYGVFGWLDHLLKTSGGE